ncbi:MAG: outer membrane lipoprotein-sorting protein [Treponema sp.]|jgi:negative regulator of sigma E activity|nr:outer membrane lipoprotein-sorting protein [Treponema sp.]
MKRIVLLMVLCVSFSGVQAVFAQTPTAAELLDRIDDNEIFTTIEYESDMIIEYQNRRYVKNMKAWARENSDSFIEFVNPEDRGTKYLKKGARLYVYSPDTEEVMLISGHMLKESMMGSDMSYEDTIENEKLSVRYNAAVSGSETWEGRDCWLLDLSAKKRTESYPKRKIWVEKSSGDCIHYELFALSGAKLKEYNLVKVEVFGGRRFPVEIEIRDLLRKNSKTTMIMRNVIMDKPIADSVFSTRNLQR